MVDTVQNFHQLLAVTVWLRSIEQVQLRHARRREVVKHASCFSVPVAILPDTLQRPDGCIDNVSRILRGRLQLFAGQIAVVGFVHGKRGCFYEHGDVPAILLLTA